MHQISRGKSTHADKLEKYLGKDVVDRISQEMKGFYYPVAINGVPGNVYAMPGGDFAGEIAVSGFLNKHDMAELSIKKLYDRAIQKAKKESALSTLVELIKAGDSRMASVGAFASVDTVIAAFTGGKGRSQPFSKVGVTGVVGQTSDLWIRAGSPPAGAAGAAAAGGTAWSSASTGAMSYTNGSTTNSNHYLNWTLNSSIINNSLLLYDRLFSVAAGNALTTATSTAVTGVPTRYQSATSTAVDYIGGNFMFPSNPTTILAATAHNWAVGTGAAGMMYTDQGSVSSNMPVIAGVSACIVGGVDLLAGNWFAPLAAGDLGVKAITNMQSSAAVATGTIDWIIGHPIAINACPIANIACLDDGLYTSLNLTPILDSACLTFLELCKPATGAATYSGILRYVSE
jgi:hypothetical protein